MEVEVEAMANEEYVPVSTTEVLAMVLTRPHRVLPSCGYATLFSYFVSVRNGGGFNTDFTLGLIIPATFMPAGAHLGAKFQSACAVAACS